MDNLIVKKLNNKDEIPYELLLLADPSRDIVDEYLQRGICYGAYIDNKVVGVYVMIKTRPLTLELVNIAVSEEHQGRGIGKALVLSAKDIAKEENAKVLEIGTGNSSITQLALYQKCGFRITSIDRDFFIKHYEEKIYENGIQCVDMIRLSMDL
jgi:ribosomal protein S18 acetylase RimI-like enzyme